MKRREIEVEICCGTNCYIMGGSHLHLLKAHLPEHLASLVKLKGKNCSGNCNDFTVTQKPPLAWVNGEIMENACIAKIEEKLRLLTCE